MENPAHRLIKLFRTRAAVATRFKVSPEAVRLWLLQGIPADRALDAEDATRDTDHAISAVEVLRYARERVRESKAAAA